MKFAKYILAVASILAVTGSVEAQPKVIAHRGHWKIDGSAQNSIKALLLADSIGANYSEFDVWMTKDSVLVVEHDGVVNGLNVENTLASVYTQQKLSNGETIPTLEEYLKVAKGLKVKLILEIKAHNDNRLETAAIKETIKMVERYGLTDRTEYVTFSKNGIKTLVKHTPKGTGIQYPKGDYLPEQIKFLKASGIDYKITVLRKHPEWITRSHELGLTVGVWTVDNEEDLLWCIEQGIDYITTNEPELLQKLLKK